MHARLALFEIHLIALLNTLGRLELWSEETTKAMSALQISFSLEYQPLLGPASLHSYLKKQCS